MPIILIPISLITFIIVGILSFGSRPVKVLTSSEMGERLRPFNQPTYDKEALFGKDKRILFKPKYEQKDESRGFFDFLFSSKKEVKYSRFLTIPQIYDLAKRVGANNPVMLTTIAMIESSGDTTARRQESGGRASTGLMQTLFGTAKELYDVRGYREYPLSSPNDLLNPEISMYFGDSYLSYIKSRKIFASEEFIVRSYNGGLGWRNSKRGLEGTANYWRKYQIMKNKVEAII